jgi:general secretion pathway protein A
VGVYEHFQLERSPFDNRADQAAFFPASLHEEALATLRFAVAAQKSCIAVVGGSGLGKTLIGRLLVQSLSTKHHVLWIPGLGQSRERLEGFAMVAGSQAELTPTTSGSLSAWLRCPARVGKSLLVVIDDADDLHAANWQELMAVLCREIDLPGPVTFVLLGGSQFGDLLNRQEFLRLRRRVFRVCPLKPIPTDRVPDYVARRLAAVGAEVQAVFSEGALEQLKRLARGNPGLINQLADNALIEAMGSERTQVAAADVSTAAYAMLGVLADEDYAHQVSDHSAQLALPDPEPQFAESDDATAASSPPVADAAPLEQAFEARMVNLQTRINAALKAVRTAREATPAEADEPDPSIETVPSEAVNAHQTD